MWGLGCAWGQRIWEACALSPMQLIMTLDTLFPFLGLSFLS